MVFKRKNEIKTIELPENWKSTSKFKFNYLSVNLIKFNYLSDFAVLYITAKSSNVCT